MTLSCEDAKAQLIEFKYELINELKLAGWKPAGNPKTRRYTSWTRGLRTIALSAPCPAKPVREMRLTLWTADHGEYIWHPPTDYADRQPFFFKDYTTDTLRMYEGFDDWMQAVREFIQ